MYLPKHFEQNDAQALHALMREHPLATLVTHAQDGLTADAVPMLYDADRNVLLGHVARANPLWHQADGRDVLAVFGGAQAYISPSWYPSKAVTHKVVPTWNYTVVHAHGTLRAIDDADWLLGFVTRLTALHESSSERPWAVADAPADYIGQMLRAIVGIEIALTRLIGKWKVSQNRDRADRDGVADGLRNAAMAALVRGDG